LLFLPGVPDERRRCQRADAKVDLIHEAPIRLALRVARDTLVVEKRDCRRSGVPRGAEKRCAKGTSAPERGRGHKARRSLGASQLDLPHVTPLIGATARRYRERVYLKRGYRRALWSTTD